MTRRKSTRRIADITQEWKASLLGIDDAIKTLRTLVESSREEIARRGETQGERVGVIAELLKGRES